MVKKADESKLDEGKIYCAKCEEEMRLIFLPKYEYEEGLPLHNVQSYKCMNCGNLFFTEEQAKEMEARTSELREYQFGFDRKVTLSGKSLVVGIPSELASHLKIKQGTKVKVIPLATEGFMIRKVTIKLRR